MNDTYKSKDNHQHLKKSMLRDAGARKSSKNEKTRQLYQKFRPGQNF